MATRDPDFPLVPHFTLPHIRIALSGTLGQGAGNEVWTMGYKILCHVAGQTTPEIPNTADLEDAADIALTSATALIQAGPSQLGGLFSDDVALTQAKATAIGPDNHIDVSKPTVFRHPAAPVRGIAKPSAGFPTLGRNPYAVAVVATLTGSVLHRGPGTYGRFYLPGPNIFADNVGQGELPLIDGLMQPATVLAFTTALGTFVNAQQAVGVNNGTFGREMVNMSVNKLDQAAVRYQPVTMVSVDNRPDTVRRRQNKLSGRGKQSTAVANN